MHDVLLAWRVMVVVFFIYSRSTTYPCALLPSVAQQIHSSLRRTCTHGTQPSYQICNAHAALMHPSPALISKASIGSKHSYCNSHKQVRASITVCIYNKVPSKNKYSTCMLNCLTIPSTLLPAPEPADSTTHERICSNNSVHSNQIIIIYYVSHQ